MTTEAWEAGWRDRLHPRIQEAGCKTVTEYLARYPGLPYVEVAKALGCAAMQLQALHMEEASHFGALRAAAADALVRSLNEHMPMGWKGGVNFEFRRASTCGMWMAVIGVHLQDETVKTRARSVFVALGELDPPKGWKPASPEDSLIRKAFDKAWDHD